MPPIAIHRIKFLRRLFLPLAILLSVPLFYNSCQGHFLGKPIGSITGSSSSCKVTLENGLVRELKTSATDVPPPFQSSKVVLFAAVAPPGQAKASSPTTTVTAGTQLATLIDNRCLQDPERDFSKDVISKSAHQSGETVAQLDRQIYLWELSQDYSEDTIAAQADLEPCVVGVSWNHTYQMQSVFNDPSLATQAHLPPLHAEEAYAHFYSVPGGMAQTGNPVILAAVDTGVDYSHPDLSANVWRHSSGIGIDITTLNTSAVNYSPLDISPVGHGTHVAGALAAVSNNAIGIMGTMPYRAQVMPIRVFKADSAGNLSTTSQYFYNAVKFAYMNGANVINLSLGSITTGAATDAVAESALTEAVQHGVVAVVVIGNADGGANGSLIDGTTMSSTPGQYSTIAGVIGVGSIDSSTGSKSYFSHYSPTFAEIGAPGAEQSGTGIYSTLPTSMGSYGRLMGTSQAAPIVSAAAGLAIGLIREAYGVPPSPSEVERLILSSAIKSPALTSYFTDGNRLDLLSLVQKINRDYPLTLKGQAAPISSACH